MDVAGRPNKDGSAGVGAAEDAASFAGSPPGADAGAVAAGRLNVKPTAAGAGASAGLEATSSVSTPSFLASAATLTRLLVASVADEAG